jgi:copper chaperone NosL
MNVLLEKRSQYLNVPLALAARGLLLAAALLMIGSYFLPLWRITAVSPSRSTQFGLAVHVGHVESVSASTDAVELGTDGSTDSRWMPFVVGGLALLLLRGAAIGTGMSLVDLSALFAYFAGFSMWSFAGRLDFYGRYLSNPTPRGVSLFVPPLFGHETIGGLLVSSFPAAGSFTIAGAGLLLALAGLVTWRRGRAEMASEIRMAA